MWKHALKVALAAGEALGKGFTKALQQELKATQQAAQAHAARTGQSTSEAKDSGTANAKLGISLDESMQILNVKTPLCPEDVQKKYDHLFNINDKTKGGSFYLQSKVYRAKERIDEEFRRQEGSSNGAKTETEEPKKKAENEK